MSFLHQVVKVGQGAKAWIDSGMIADIIAKVFIRRWIERREPNGVNSKICQVVEPGSNTGQIAQTVTRCIGKGARINLIDDPIPPP